MAVSLSPLPSFLSLLLSNSSPKSTTHRIRRRPSIAVTRTTCTCSAIASDSKNNGLSSEEKRVLQERYGYDPEDFLSQPSSKSNRRRRGRKGVQKGERESLFLREDPKPPRTTHKLLQVLGGKARRKKLLSPKGMDVRPMTEVVKGAAFDILQGP